jgi:transposase IS481 family protein
VSARTARTWPARDRAEGERGLLDRSSRPHRIARRTDPALERAVLPFRRARMPGGEIAACLGMAERTVSRIPHRAGLGRLLALEPAEPANRFETRPPGSAGAYIDVKTLARIDGAGHQPTGSRRGQRTGRVGWERVHVAADGAACAAPASAPSRRSSPSHPGGELSTPAARLTPRGPLKNVLRIRAAGVA